MENGGGAGTYGIFAAINFLSFLFYWKVVPETKFHSLEELELKFQKDYSGERIIHVRVPGGEAAPPGTPVC